MNYQNGKIYKIVSENTEKIYIGSTCSPLSKRLYEHKANYKNYLDGAKNKISSYQIFELGEVDIILIENYPCNDKNELHARERYWMEQNKEIIINKYRPNKLIELGKKEYNSEYRKHNKDKIVHQKKEYYDQNKEKIIQKTKIYSEMNKEKVRERLNKKYDCECGGKYTHANKNRHIKSPKHQANLKEQEEFENRQITITKHSFDFIFECDSKMLLPKTYPNIIPV